MITKNDCLSILVKLEDTGLNVDSYVKKLLISKEVPIDVLKFIAANRGIEATNFYEMLRKKHNKNKSPLYTNILNEDISEDKVVITLSCLLTQIILYANKLEADQKDTFLKECRAEEITRVLNLYFKDSSIEAVVQLLNLIRIDLMVLEGITGRREI